MELKTVAIAGTRNFRSSVFAPRVNEIFGSGKPTLGQRSDQGWYDSAKEEVSQFDDYTERTRRIANKAVREQLWNIHVGNPSNPESGAYRRNSVAANIAEAESYTPVNTLVFSVDRVRNRVSKLESINHVFKRELENAELNWGLLPEPQIIEKVVEVEVPGATPSWVIPTLLVGGLAVGVLALAGVFGGD